jgi:hypothetical protein
VLDFLGPADPDEQPTDRRLELRPAPRFQLENDLEAEDVAVPGEALRVVAHLQRSGRLARPLDLAHLLPPSRSLSEPVFSLRDLEDAGLVLRRVTDDRPPQTRYEATRAGRAIADATRSL